MREDSPPLEDAFPTLGTLTLLRRKTGEIAQTFPIDAERITFGRDYECDVRLYLQDVSKIHAEIQFDLVSGAATLHVFGTNGVIHTPTGGRAVQMKAPSQVTLADGDTFAIRKKLFRFTYGEQQATPSYLSPMVPRTMPATSTKDVAGTPVRRRASMRLSIVPEGKRFVPSPARSRPNTGTTPHKTPTKSNLSKQANLEPPQEFDELLAMEEGDEGDKLFLERKEEEDTKPVYLNPFMTPQLKSKVQIRNTSAVPRTRKLQFSLPGEGENEDRAAQFDDATEDPRPTATSSPAPLPLASDTSSLLPMTPVRLPVPAISAQLAYSIPRGPVSLRKSVVIRNGWRAELDSKPKQDIDTEIAKGHIETRRRRSSSGLSSGRKSLSPKMPVATAESSSESSESDDDKENTPTSQASLRWVYENGMEDVSQLDDSDSDGGSFEFDSTLPGQGMIDFASASAESPSGSEEEEPSDEHDLDEEDVSDALSDEDGDIPSDIDDEVDSSNVIDPASLAYERTPSPVVPARLYSSSPTQPGLGSPRLSLSSIGGPAVRFTPKAPPTPSYGRGFPMTPTGRLGPPSRAESTPAPVNSWDDETDEDEEAFNLIPATPKTPKLPNGGLSKSQREALGTPRDLPAPPPSFRNAAPTPVKGATPSLHRVFEPVSPEAVLTTEPPRTPFDDIKRRLSALRIGSQTSGRKQQPDNQAGRTPAGLAPETPSKESSSFSRPVPATPRVDSIAESEESLPWSPVDDNGDAPNPASPSDEATPKHKRRRSLVSPSFAGLRDMLKTTKEPKTPSMSGMRSMFKTPKAIASPKLDGVRELQRVPKHTRTPSFKGLKNLLKEPEERASPSLTGVKEMLHEENTPSTPMMSGMREMFTEAAVPPTPALDGVADMFEGSEEDQVEMQVDAEEEEAQTEGDEARNQESESETAVEPSEPSSPAKLSNHSRLPTRSTRTTSTRGTHAPSGPLEPPKAKRTTRAAPESASEPVRRSTRAKSSAPATSEDEQSARSAPAPARRTRATRSATAEVEEKSKSTHETKSEPVRRSRRVLGEAAKQPEGRSGCGNTEPGGKENGVGVEPPKKPKKIATKSAEPVKKSGIAVPARATRSRKA